MNQYAINQIEIKTSEYLDILTIENVPGEQLNRTKYSDSAWNMPSLAVKVSI